MTLPNKARRATSLLAASALVSAGLASAGLAGAAAAADTPTPTLGAAELAPRDLPAPAVTSDASAGEVGPRSAGPAAASGTRTSYLLKLDPPGTIKARNRAGGTGPAANRAAVAALAQVQATQEQVIADLPSGTPVIYKTHAIMAGVAVSADPADLDQLEAIDGVAAVYPITPKRPSLSSSIPLQGGPAAWQASSTGTGVKVAIIDTGIDYTHADFGGAGTTAAFTAAQAITDRSWITSKVVEGYDLVGDNYNADFAATATPHPDANPLDCNGHGSHVAGIAAGQGVTTGGTPYTGPYDTSINYSNLRIGPGMAPQASLMAFRVFGCSGSTDVVAAALDRAVDPDGNPATDDGADVINMSLGSDFGSPRDADSVASNAAVDAGVVLSVSAGNSDDVTDVGGSPGDAKKVITVASSMDSQNIADGAAIQIDSGTPTNYAVTRAILYNNWASTDLTGPVVASPATNPDACRAYTNPEAAQITGKVVLVKWTQGNLECGSITRGAKLRAAGAKGFILANSEENFSGGINGDTVIPGVLMAKSGADAIRAALGASQAVTVNGTSTNSVVQSFPADTDKLSSFSSRGIHEAGNLKPDVAAVGDTVFSVSSGTGSDGESISGTSMAAPTVAGLAALVLAAHPTWTPQQVKAAIVNTAGADVTTAGGDRYAPVRVGAGRIVADAAASNEVLAYVADDPGAVSVSFGPVEVSGPTSVSKTVRVANTGASAASYAVSYDPITKVAGTDFQVSPAQVTVPAGEVREVTVTFTATSRAALDNSVDPTVGRLNRAGDTPRSTLAEASGLLLLTPGSGTELRVPVYAAPRPVSALTGGAQAAIDAVTHTGSVTITGAGLGFGDNATLDEDPTNDINSIGAAFELAATDPAAPPCTTPGQPDCYVLADDRAADIRRVGVSSTSDYAYFAVATDKPWSTPNRVEFDLWLDTDHDNQADYVAYTTFTGADDVLVTKLVDLGTNKVVATDPLNGLWGNVDTAIYDSDALIIPVRLSALAGVNAANPRINYGITSWARSPGGPVDLVGVDASTDALGLSVDLFHPGLAATGPNGLPIYPETNGTVLQVTRDEVVYQANNSQGLMLVHLHNAVGAKSEVLGLQTAAAPTTTGLALSQPTVEVGNPVTLSVEVAGAVGVPAGAVSVVQAETGAVIAAGSLDPAGRARFTYTPGVTGSVRLVAKYAGDASNQASTSAEAVLTVTAPAPPPPAATATSTRLSVAPATLVRGAATTLTVSVSGTGDPTGPVSVVDSATGAVVATGTLQGGAATLKFTPMVPNLMTLQAVYPGNATFAASASPFVALQVTPAASQVTLKLSKKSGNAGKKVTATVTVATVNAIPATGVVKLTSKGKVVATGTLVNGTAKITYKPRKKGTVTLRATYGGDPNYAAGKSKTAKYKVKYKVK